MMVESLEQMLTRHEGYKLKMYRDTIGKITIGVGHNLDDRGISHAVAALMLKEDIADAAYYLRKYPWYRDLNNTRQKAMLNMMFNLGPTRFAGFKKMIAAMAIGDFFEASMQAKDSVWYTQVGNRAVEVCSMIRHG